jgi:inhibitor of KinA
METTTANNLTIYPISEGAVTIEFGNAIDESLMRRIGNFNQLLRQKPFPGIYDTVPAYTTLSVFFDPMVLIQVKDMPGKSCFEKISGYLNQVKDEENPSSISETKIISIPVCYGGSLGPDLEYVAIYHQITVDEVIKLHSSAIYTVYMIGFIPGFAYMGGLNDLLETPRKATPLKVPAGAVGIAGKQTGIYPLETPGGWQIIGQTPFNLFDANRQPPALLKAGDKIRFESISYQDLKKY